MPNSTTKTLVVTSDFHSYLPDTVPECDLLLLAGDVLANPYNLSQWIDRQPAKEIVGIAGNHDWSPYEDCPDTNRAIRNYNWTYLQDESTVAGGFHIWGSPWTPPFKDWAFMKPEQELEQLYRRIPPETEILLTHGPPRGILDRNSKGYCIGSFALYDAMRKLPNLKLHVFGHAHEDYGLAQIYVPRAGAPDGRAPVTYVNGSFLGYQGKPGNEPIVLGLDVSA